MSIQNRLLFVYTSVYVVAFVIFATIVYTLPRLFILAEIDQDLMQLSEEIMDSRVSAGNGNLRIALPPELNTLQTSSTFLLLADRDGEITFRSPNLSSFTGSLDANGFMNEMHYSQVKHEATTLRVLTVPVFSETSERELAGYIQVARLVDSIESFNRLLIIALFVGFAAALAALFLAVLLTPGSFRPLEEIANATLQITNADDLSRRVPDADRTDEIGMLARAINQTLERLERLFETQQRLLADVSHELRTPLTTIRGNVDLMRRMGKGDPESMDSIEEEVDRMTRLVGDLLLLARADAGGLPLAKTKVELDSLIFEVYRQLLFLAKDKVEVSLTAVDPVCVYGDTDRLKQLLLNLGSNSIKYTPPGGKLSLRLSLVDSTACIEVKDTGIGIPAEDLPYIFDRFYRVDKARSREQGGTGLGLSIAKWIARAHGGQISVTSKVGEGTTFTLMLPAIVQESDRDAVVLEQQTETRSPLRAIGSSWRRRWEDDKNGDAG